MVGDIHGKLEVVEAVLNLNRPTVFMGDILDSHIYDAKECFECLDMVLRAVESRPDCYCVIGNHEAHYIHHQIRGTGYSFITETYLHNSYDEKRIYKQAISDLMVPYLWMEGFLISHAGVSQKLLDSLGLTLEEYLDSGKFYGIGAYRGGPDVAGGLLWCDWNHEFEPIEGVPQIVGHTPVPSIDIGIRKKGNSYCVDCLDVLWYDKGRKTANIAEISDGVLIERSINIETGEIA